MLDAGRLVQRPFATPGRSVHALLKLIYSKFIGFQIVRRSVTVLKTVFRCQGVR